MNGATRLTVAVVVVALVLSACTTAGDLPESTSLPAASSGGGASSTTGETSASPANGPLPVDLEPTPPQQEGPYYPTVKPDDRDNDLTLAGSSGGTPAGTVLLLDGKLLTTGAQPISGAVVEIWQTDANGIYLHPDDPQTADRDPYFQFYGESVTDGDGGYSFRTIDPGYYEPRPRHIHVKVRIDGTEVLTTQIYFAGDERLAASQVAEGLVAETVAAMSGETEVLVATHDLIIDF